MNKDSIVAEKAYMKFLGRERKHGRDLEDWFNAEQEYYAEQNIKTVKPLRKVSVNIEKPEETVAETPKKVSTTKKKKAVAK